MSVIWRLAAICLTLAGCTEYESWSVPNDSISTKDGIVVFLEKSKVRPNRGYFIDGHKGDKTRNRRVFAVKISASDKGEPSSTVAGSRRCLTVDECDGYPRNYVLGDKASSDIVHTSPNPVNIPGAMAYNGMRGVFLQDDQIICSVFESSPDSSLLDLNGETKLLKIMASKAKLRETVHFYLGSPELISKMPDSAYCLPLKKVLPTDLKRYGNQTAFEINDISDNPTDGIDLIYGTKNTEISLDYREVLRFSSNDGQLTNITSLVYPEFLPGKDSKTLFASLDNNRLITGISLIDDINSFKLKFKLINLKSTQSEEQFVFLPKDQFQ